MELIRQCIIPFPSTSRKFILNIVIYIFLLQNLRRRKYFLYRFIRQYKKKILITLQISLLQISSLNLCTVEVKLEVKKMPTKILDGKIIAAEISQQLKKRILQQKLSPRLAIILCGEDPASVLYITMKKKACEEIGIQSELHTFPETISASEICSHINRLQKEADGI